MKAVPSNGGESKRKPQPKGRSRGSRTFVDPNVGLIDQRVSALSDRHRKMLLRQLNATDQVDDHKLRSAAFAALCMQTLTGIDEASAIESVTDGSQDAGIDALHIGDVNDGEFVVTVVQAKYSRSLDGRAGFPANSISRVINSVRLLFDPHGVSQPVLNSTLSSKLADIHSLIMDGNIPEVRVLLSNNGQKWESNGEAEIAAARLPPNQVSFTHVNHESLVELFKRRRSNDVRLRLAGKGLVDDLDFRRVMVGRLPVSQVKALFDTHGDTLLDRNVRRYLGMRDNRVNVGIHTTLANERERENFFFFNNGITAVCSKFSHNALQATDWDVSISGFEIVNGGQTSKTIQRTLSEAPNQDYSKAFVLFRLYEIGSEDDGLTNSITFATNSQSPVDFTDLRSNDPYQEKLAVALQDLGYEYKRKRDDQAAAGPEVITSSVAAESVMAAWKRKPHLAKFRRSKLFSDFYTEVFDNELQASHVVLSVLAFRVAENERKRPGRSPEFFVPYASHFLAMVIVDLLLEKLRMTRKEVSHLNLAKAKATLDEYRKAFYKEAVGRVAAALKELGITDSSQASRVAGQFRRGDLLEPLQRARQPEQEPKAQRRVSNHGRSTLAKSARSKSEGRRESPGREGAGSRRE